MKQPGRWAQLAGQRTGDEKASDVVFGTDTEKISIFFFRTTREHCIADVYKNVLPPSSTV